MRRPVQGDVFHQDEPLELFTLPDGKVAVKLEDFPAHMFMCLPSPYGWVYLGACYKEEEFYRQCTEWN